MSGPGGHAADVLVVGAGLAGLHVATLLAGRGHAVSVVDKRTDLGRSVRTTGIFVRRTLDDFALPADRLGPPIRRVALYPPSLRRPVVLVSDRDEFRVGDMPGLYAAFTDRARAAGARVLLGTRYAGYADGAAQLVGTDGAPSVIRPRFVVGADGARSRVARDLGLDRNRRLLVGAEEVVPSAGTDVPTFHCVLHPRLAPGYLGWVVDDGEHVHLGTAGYAARYPEGVWRAVRELAALAPGVPPRPAAVERRGGPIPVGGLLRRISSPRGLLVGDAAGAVSPLTAGGLDPCLRLSEHAADALDEALTSGDTGALRSYDGAALRRRFRGRVAMRRTMGLVRSPAAMEVAFAGLRTVPGRQAARSIFFADRSFPLPAPA
ncbi:NAD(P)/FAD-dependent oxidoreductase [Georgenia satyanarayanai]|uniref:NAD(P)/FAD-dependent oxidoreductase n=1 Tax=Georgenia satyanarayanai TaxID=860221 RepID=UPI001264E243|nr:NAD(P)/FAD-dependent oxidoreductase [Georgenia satyanarayanai]